MIPISDTEECVQASIDNDAAWHSSYDSELNILISSINQLLNNNSDDSLYTLCTFLTEPDIIKTFNGIPEIAHCLVAVNITAEEFNNNLTTPLYLKNIHNIEQVIKKNNYYKFLILNIEYDVDAEIALKCIAKDINDGTLSSLALEQFIKTTCVDGCDNVRKIISNYISSMNVNSDIISKTNTAIINNNSSNPKSFLTCPAIIRTKHNSPLKMIKNSVS